MCNIYSCFHYLVDHSGFQYLPLDKNLSDVKKVSCSHLIYEFKINIIDSDWYKMAMKENNLKQEIWFSYCMVRISYILNNVYTFLVYVLCCPIK